MDAMLGPALGATIPIGESTLRTLKVQKLDEESVGMKTCRGRVLLQHAGAIAAGNAGTIVGLALGWSAGALEVLHGVQGFPVTLEQWSWVSSLMPIGAAVGALPAGRLVQSLGRKAVILGLGPVTLAAWLLHLWASSVWMLYAGRLLLGAAVGAAIVAAPIFVAEMAQPAIRGALSTYFQVLLCLGILAVYAGGKFLSVRWLNMCCLATSVLHVAGFAWFPDTPRWYLLRGRPGDARKAMLFYRGPDYDVDAELQLVLEGIKAAAVATNGRPRRDSNPETEPLLGRRDNDGWGALASPVARKTMAMCLVLVVLQQITGVNAITFYTTQLFEGAGGMDAYSASIVVASVEVAATVVSMYLVDRAGRRVLLLATGAAMAVCTGLLGLFFFFQEGLRHDMAAVSCAPVILVSVYMFMFACGWGPVTWVFVGEVFPDNVKGVATGLSSTTVWLSAFLVTKFYPGVALALGNFTCYWAFFALCVLACLFVALVLPETKGKSLDEIQALL